MRRLELLIEMVRSQSGNTQYSQGQGVQTNDIIQYIQNAQDFLFSQANQQKPKYFLQEPDLIPVVSGQEVYSAPARTYLNAIDTVEYSSSGRVTEFYTLTKFSLKERSSTHSGFPSGYISRGQDILLVPPADSGSLRINRIRELDRLDIRRGRISALTEGASSVTALTINPADSSFDATQLNKYNYLCVVDRNGAVKMRNLEYDTVDATTGVVTITGGSFEHGSTESIAIGDYVTAGENTTNKSVLPDTCERFLIKHAVYETKHGDKSKWSQETRKDMIAMAEDIIGAFSVSSEDICTVPITDTEYMGSDYLF